MRDQVLGYVLLTGIFLAASAAASDGPAGLNKSQWTPASSSPGRELSLVEHKRERFKELSGATLVSYHLAATGFERQERYGLWIGFRKNIRAG